jgi:prepilin-type N-terminal cleavage/methylation domain-containing protein
MQKGFTLAETLITMAVIGVIMALSIPAIIQNTNDTKPLFKKAYNTVEEMVNDLINDTVKYPDGEFTDGTFCNYFFSKLNTIGYVASNCDSSFVDAIPDTPVATTSNSMRWYGAQNDFTAGQCDEADTNIDDSINTCIKISVDVNGANKGANTNADQANKDIFTIYITKEGKVAVKSSSANVYDEAYLLQN